MGSNMAEAHPVGFQWVMEAKSRGAKVFHIDPRFTRTSALADRHVTLRAGTDIAFLGGVINYILTNDKWFKEYVLHYTNAATIVQEGFQDTEDLDGIFSGYNAEDRAYHADRGPQDARHVCAPDVLVYARQPRGARFDSAAERRTGIGVGAVPASGRRARRVGRQLHVERRQTAA